MMNIRVKSIKWIFNDFSFECDEIGDSITGLKGKLINTRGYRKKEGEFMKSKKLTVIVCLLIILTGLIFTQENAAYIVSTHEYIVFQALDLYPNDANTELYEYRNAIRDGAIDEDSTDHVYDRSGLFTTITHFWQGDSGPIDPVDNYFGEDGENAWQKAQVLWGMALGEYEAGDKWEAYEYLGHVAHLLADMSVPCHAHEDLHVEGDDYEDWMTRGEAQLQPEEIIILKDAGPVKIPEEVDIPEVVYDENLIEPKSLYYLFYTMNQIGDFFDSSDCSGDSGDYYGGWMDEIYTELEMKNNDGYIARDWKLAREYSYLYSIRAVASLFKLFDDTINKCQLLTVVIDKIKSINGHEGIFRSDAPDYFVKVYIDGLWFINEGNQRELNYFSPNWGFAREVGDNEIVNVIIQLWDEDEDPDPDDLSDIDFDPDKDLNMWINLTNGDILWENFWFYSEEYPKGRAGDGKCEQQLFSWGYGDESSEIWFHINISTPQQEVTSGPEEIEEGVRKLVFWILGIILIGLSISCVLILLFIVVKRKRNNQSILFRNME